MPARRAALLKPGRLQNDGFLKRLNSFMIIIIVSTLTTRDHMTNHCFISYSTADGVDFTRRLAEELEGGDPFYVAWYDKRDLAPGDDWDDQIVEAIKTCKCMIFLMTEDSTKAGSDCKKEIVFALRYKKPIVPLLIHKKAEPIFVLGTREWIDFTGEFKAGMGKLHKYLRELDLPEGILRTLKERLADAEHDLRRAKEEEEQRIKAEIEELKDQIQVQQKVVANPEAAKAQTQQNIQTGLERERKPEKPTAAPTSTKFINQPPGVAQIYFRDREMETEQVILFLKNDAQRIMTIVGRGGAGKTAMVCRLLKHLENGTLPDDFEKKYEKVKVDGIVYLSEVGSRKINFANLFADLCLLLPADISARLTTLYKEPQTSTEVKTLQLLEALKSLGQIIALLDNFEYVVDSDAQSIKDMELDEALRTILHAPHHPLKTIVTTRVTAHHFDLYEPARQRLLPLDSGLAPVYAKEAFISMDENNLVGIRNANDNLLDRVVTRTLGLPRALEALYAALRSDRYTTLEELIALPILPENVVRELVGEAFSRLDTNAQKVMQALAVYNRPVTSAAVDYVLAPHLPAVDSAPILQRLANMHFARKESGRFYLHPVDREYAFGLIPAEDSTAKDAKGAKKSKKESLRSSRALAPVRGLRFNKYTQHDLTLRAADYFAQARKPRAEWKKLDDLSVQLAEFDLRYAAGDYDTAANVLSDFDFDYLLLWGHYRLLINLYLQVVERIQETKLRIGIIINLATAHRSVGDVKDSIGEYEKALALSRENESRYQEGAALGSLGNAYADLGEARKAIEFHEHALVISREIGDRRGEGTDLGNLGGAYADLGEARKAIEYYEQALVIAREIGDRRGEGNNLGGLAACYETAGQMEKAIEYQENSLAICREIGDRNGEGASLSMLGSYHSELGNHQQAKKHFEGSVEIARQTGYRYGEGFRLLNLAHVEIEFGNYREAIELALASTKIANAISSPDLQSHCYGGLCLAYLLSEHLTDARDFIEQAQTLNLPRNNFNVSALHGIIALRQEDVNAACQAFARAIAQADEILAKTPDFYGALDAKGLASCGLALTQDLTGLTESHPDKVDSVGDLSGLVTQAIETFRKARKIAPHAGVVKSVLRLFDELAKCDESGLLKPVRAAVEGKE
jgi:tetratricopeptide (TPR) repeat protein